jgi:uncharacterized protein YbjT (DUF2867 family)
MSVNTYKNVLLVGAAGDLGKHILTGLLADSTFDVTVLTRINSTSSFPSNVKVIKIDYSNKDALKKALTGQDVIISTIGNDGILAKFDQTLVEAAIEAGVKWFIPSEFTGDTSHPDVSSLTFMTAKVETSALLKKHQSQLAHTFITTGGFLDWGFDNGFLSFDIPNHTVTLYDDGKNQISCTTLPTIGKAVAAILHHPELTLNKRIYIADATFTQQEALVLFEKYTDSKWTKKYVTTEESFKQGKEHLANGDIYKGIHAQIMSFAYNGQGSSNFQDKTSNKALGLETISLEQIVKEAVERSKSTKHQ